jgi:hypothetical protein
VINVPNVLKDLVIDRVDLVDEGANSEAYIKLYKRKEPKNMNFDEILKSLDPEAVKVVNAEMDKAKAEVPADVVAKLETAEADLKKAKDEKDVVAAELAKAKESTKEDSTPEDVMKSLDPAVQEIFKSMKAQKEAAEAIAKQLSDQKIEDEAIAKARELKALPTDEKALVSIVKSATPEVFELLKSVNKLIDESEILKQKGSEGSDSNTDAWSKIEKAADELVVSEKITKEKAIDKVIKAQPDLYREYLKGGK